MKVPAVYPHSKVKPGVLSRRHLPHRLRPRRVDILRLGPTKDVLCYSAMARGSSMDSSA
jgi:hypothetical protein